MINDHLSISDKALGLLKGIEKLRLKPYDDQTGRPIAEWCSGATIGYGYLIPESEWPKYAAGISKQQAVALLEKTLRPTENTVRRAIVVALEQHQFDALVLLAFNIGGPKFRTSSAVRMINDKRAVTDYVTLEAAWLVWNKSHGQENDGLKNRRACEWRVWDEGVYERW